MKQQNKNLKSGLELLLLLDLTLATMDDYHMRGPVKNKANLFKNALEKSVNNSIDDITVNNEHFLHNATKKKQRMIKQMASLSEADNVLLSEFVNKFIEKIELVREKGVVMFEDIL
jgi:hypothetical protein